MSGAGNEQYDDDSAEEEESNEYDENSDDSDSDDDEESEDDEESVGDEENGISKEEQERALAELAKKKEDDVRAAEEAAKKKAEEDSAKNKVSLKTKLKAATDLIKTTSAFSENRRLENEQAVETFMENYRICCQGKQGDRVDKYVPKKEQARQTSFFTGMKTYISDCESFKRCVLDGELDSIPELPPWHCIAALDSLMMSGGTGDKSHISIRMPRRQLTDGEMSKVIDILESRQKINTLCLSGTAGWEQMVDDGGKSEEDDDDVPRYTDLLIDALTKAKETNKFELYNLELEYSLPNDHRAQAFWVSFAALVSQHKTLSCVKLAFKRRKTVVAHNMMEAHIDDNTEMMPALIKVGLTGNTKLRQLSLSRCGLTDRNVVDLLRALKTMSLTDLNLSENSLGERGVTTLSGHIVKYGKYLKKLNIYGNNCQDGGAKELCLAVLAHPNLTSLNIGQNDLTSVSVDNIIYLIRSKSNLSELMCSMNFLGRDTSRILKEMILNKCVYSLDLSYNVATETSSPSLFRLLRKNKTLTDLNFEGNQLPPEAGGRLHEIFTIHTTKETKDEPGTKSSENNTLLHFGVFQGNFIHTEICQFIEKTLEFNRETHGKEVYPYEPEKLRPKYDHGKRSSSLCSIL